MLAIAGGAWCGLVVLSQLLSAGPRLPALLALCLGAVGGCVIFRLLSAKYAAIRLLGGLLSGAGIGVALDSVRYGGLSVGTILTPSQPILCTLLALLSVVGVERGAEGHSG